MRSADCSFGMFAYLILFTGCRRGEALALQWKDVDLTKNIISINKSVNYNGADQNKPVVSQHTKSAAGMRSVIILDCLKNRLEQQEEDNKEYYLFGGEKPLTKSAFRKRWQKYLKETDLNITPHQLRRAYAMLLYDAGIDEKLAQDLMGHSSIQLTKNIYTHIRTSRKENAAKELNSFVKGLITK